MVNGTHVRAIHRDGVLRLLTPLELPDGAQVSVIVLRADDDEAGPSESAQLVHPTRLVPEDRLDALTGLLSIGGDALADSEALYD
jgi:predicted DNA-binding antitoxin AbrB/MazE fold protein